MNTLYRVTPIFVDPQTSCVYVNGMTDMSSSRGNNKSKSVASNNTTTNNITDWFPL